MVEKVGVIGLGHLGLPLSVVLAKVGYSVIGVDVDREKVEKLQKGSGADIYEPRLDELLAAHKERLSFTTDYKDLTKCSTVFITVGTPVDKRGDPDYTYMDSAIESLGPHLQKGQLMVLKSTVVPGTTKDYFVPRLEELSGLRAGKDFFAVYCPERTIEGDAVRELQVLPKIIGGIDDESIRRAEEIMGALGGKIISVSSPRVAELAKIYDNVSRAMNIALANELGMVCEKAGVDSYELVSAVNNSYDRTHLFFPGLGADGPCLSKEPCILRHYMRAKEVPSPVVDACVEMNTMSTRRIAEMISDFAEGLVKPVISLVGVAFKGVPETDDTRDSPAAKIHNTLKDRGGMEFRFCDPLVNEFAGEKVCKSLEDCVKDANVVVFLTNHSDFMGVDPKLILSKAGRPLKIIDCWHNLEDAKRRDIPEDVEIFRVGDGSP